METKLNDTYLTVSEYAKLRGVSVAAVYKRLDGTLKPYVKIIDGKRFLDMKVLEIEGIKPVENGIIPGLNTPESQESPGTEEQNRQTESPGFSQAAFVKALEALERQLSEKDNQISRLQEEAAELRQAAAAKDKFIQEQANRLTLLLEQSQELQRNNQVLLGIAQGAKPANQREAQEESQGEEAPAGRPHQEAQEEATPPKAQEAQEEAPAEEQTAPARPRGFWSWLFRGYKQ